MTRVEKLAFIIGLSDFGPGRALYLSKILQKLGFVTTILTNSNVYVKDNQGINRNVVTFNLNWINYNALLGRIIFYILFSLLCFLASLKTIIHSRFKQILIIARHPYPLSIIISLLAKRLTNNNRQVKVVADVTDLWPESLLFMDDSFYVKFMIKVGIAINKRVYPRVDAIVVHNYPFKLYVEKVYLSEGKTIPITIIPHVIDLSRFRPMTKNEAISRLESLLRIDAELKQKLRSTTVIGYAGLISTTIGSELLLKLIEQLKDDKFTFVIVGEGPFKRELIKFVKMRKINNVVFTGPFPHEVMTYVYNLFDVAVITSYFRARIAPTIYWFPKKIVEYSSCGIPTMYVGLSKIIDHLLKKYDAGLVIKPEEMGLKTIMRYLNKIILHYAYFSLNARRMAEEEFSLEKATESMRRLLDILSEHEN